MEFAYDLEDRIEYTDKLKSTIACFIDPANRFHHLVVVTKHKQQWTKCLFGVLIQGTFTVLTQRELCGAKFEQPESDLLNRMQHPDNANITWFQCTDRWTQMVNKGVLFVTDADVVKVPIGAAAIAELTRPIYNIDSINRKANYIDIVERMHEISRLVEMSIASPAYAYIKKANWRDYCGNINLNLYNIPGFHYPVVPQVYNISSISRVLVLNPFPFKPITPQECMNILSILIPDNAEKSGLPRISQIQMVFWVIRHTIAGRILNMPRVFEIYCIDALSYIQQKHTYPPNLLPSEVFLETYFRNILPALGGVRLPYIHKSSVPITVHIRNLHLPLGYVDVLLANKPNGRSQITRSPEIPLTTSCAKYMTEQLIQYPDLYGVLVCNCSFTADAWGQNTKVWNPIIVTDQDNLQVRTRKLSEFTAVDNSNTRLLIIMAKYFVNSTLVNKLRRYECVALRPFVGIEVFHYVAPFVHKTMVPVLDHIPTIINIACINKQHNHELNFDIGSVNLKNRWRSEFVPEFISDQVHIAKDYLIA